MISIITHNQPNEYFQGKFEHSTRLRTITNTTSPIRRFGRNSTFTAFPPTGVASKLVGIGSCISSARRFEGFRIYFDHIHRNVEGESKSQLSQVIYIYRKNVPNYDVEHSSVLLYYVQTLDMNGKTADALRILDASARSRAIVDRSAIMECRGKFNG